MKKKKKINGQNTGRERELEDSSERLGDRRRSARGGPRRPGPHPLSPPLLSLAGVVRASSIFPILSAILLLLGGVCVAASRVYKSKRNIILGAGILFVAAGERQREGAATCAGARVCVCVCARVSAIVKPPCPRRLLGPGAFLGSS